ncbi:hypothetical protein G9C98_007811 [Cotesia typhae]|uniref:Uncharacterized protein n=1 Tax=Cotesia typhae TaxID=2053667 RepID=A0A8J5QV90_9HYME|nr:hypothetical protein G9C98_007811 [Cotesia typhae]
MLKLLIISTAVFILNNQPSPTLQENFFLKPPKIKVYSNSDEFRHMNRSLLELLLNATVNHQKHLSNSVDPALVEEYKNFHTMLEQNLNLKKQVSSSSFDSLNVFEDKTD